MAWLESLVNKYSGLKKISFLLNKDQDSFNRIICYQIQNQCKVPINPVVISESEKMPKKWSEKKSKFEHLMLKRLWEGCRDGQNEIVGRQAPDMEIYDPMAVNSSLSLRNRNQTDACTEQQIATILEALKQI